MLSVEDHTIYAVPKLRAYRGKVLSEEDHAIVPLFEPDPC